MEQNKIFLMDLENDLSVKSKMVNDLIYASQNLNKYYLRNKACELSEQISKIKYQASYCNPSGETDETMRIRLAIKSNSDYLLSKLKVYIEENKNTENNEPNCGNTVYKEPQAVTYYSKMESQKEKDRGFEKLVGGKIMGIAAALLIFIGIVLFAVTAFPLFTDNIKILCMFFISIVCSAIGIDGMRKKKNDFYTVIAGIGSGGIFLSTMLAYSYFGILEGFITYVMLFLVSRWLCYLSYKFDCGIFSLTARIGVCISAISGMVLSGGDSFEMTVISVYCAATMLMITLTEKSRKIRWYLYIGHIFSLVTASMMIWIVYFYWEWTDVQYVMLFSSAVILLSEIYRFYMESAGNEVLSILQKLLYPFYLICFSFLFSAFDLPDLINAILVYFAGRTFVVITENHYNAEECNNLSRWIGIIPVTLYTLLQLITLQNGFVLAVVFISMSSMFYGVKKGSRGYYAIWLGSLLLSAVSCSLFNQNPAVYLVFPAYFAVYMYTRKDAKGWVVRGLGYTVSLFALTISMLSMMYGFKSIMYSMMPSATWISYLFSDATVYLIISAIHIILHYRRQFTEKKETACFRWVTVALMAWSCSMLYSVHFPVLIAIIAIELFCLHSAEIYREWENKTKACIYLCIKYTFFILVVLDALNAADILRSLLMLVVAIASISLGFYVKQKAFRVYGLVLSIISIFKLIMIDLWSGNMIAEAVGFIICGLLCLGISYIYNKISSKFN